MEYHKRLGTSGIAGQLYESKLLALILFRLQRDESVEHFHLATNMDNVGDFDDICVVLKKKGHDRPIALFIQLKHKESDKVVIKTENKDKVKFIESFCKIKDKISCDNFFKENITETDFMLILYTNAKFDIANSESKLESTYARELNLLLTTSDTGGCRAQASEQLVSDFEVHFLENDIMVLTQHLVKFLIDKENTKSMEIMNDGYILQYHVILKNRVVDISHIQTDNRDVNSKWRTLTFKQNFFTNDDRYILLFRNHLIKIILKNYRKRLSVEMTTPEPSTNKIISDFLSDPSAATLTPLILSHIECNEDGKLEFKIKRPPKDIELLQQINIQRKEIDDAIFAAKASVKKYLQSLELKVPISFGNIDLTIRGNDEKVKKRLEHLSTVICGLCEEYEQIGPYKIVTIDDRVGDGSLSPNGGLASAVGNILTYDTETKMLKFSNEFTSEQNIANALFDILNKTLDNSFQYQFDVKTKKFPKLHFDCSNIAREFLSKLVIYEKQSNHYNVEKILKEHVEERLRADRHDFVMKYSQSVESVFLHYHDEVLKWWMSPKGTYLTKTNNLYKQAITSLEAEPQMSALHTMFCLNNTKYFSCSFSEAATKAMVFKELPSKVFIATETVVLTTVKVIQCLRNKDLINKCAVLNFEFVLKLPNAIFSSLCKEVKKTNNLIILVLADAQNYADPDERLSRLSLATTETQLVVVTNNELKEIIIEHFRITNDVFRHETESLLNIEQRNEIIQAARVIMQGQEVNLQTILDDTSVIFLEGDVLDKVIRNETINIGKPLSNTGYEQVKDLYIDRTLITRYIPDDSNSDYSSEYNKFGYVSSYSDRKSHVKEILVRTFLDTVEGEILLSAPPGMGKTTLLTHLALNTQKEENKLWIVRVNFIDHSQQFHEWYDNDINVNVSESIKLLCQIALNNNSISFDVDIAKNGEVHLVNSTGDHFDTFELNMFLHFYNKSRLIYVFDGFDEICPHYKNKVVDFLTVAKTSLRKKKMWVTSRPYSDILPDLVKLSGTSLKMEYLSFTEQEIYLRKFWRKKLRCRKLNENQLTNLQTFMNTARQTVIETNNWIRRIYNIFVDVVKPLLHEKDVDVRTEYKNTGEMTSQKQSEELSGIPLLLYFIADYFVNVVNIKTRSKSAFELNMHNIYKIFIENKVKAIIFEDKVKLDLSNTITRGMLEKELFDCINIHKKLAVSNFYQQLHGSLEFEELIDIKPMSKEELYIELDKIKTGTNKTGLISHVTVTNTSVFIHRSFEEYFISEYICDILKSDKYDLSHKNLLYCAVFERSNRGVIDWIHLKRNTDKTFQHIFEEMEEVLPLYKNFDNVYFINEHMSMTKFIRVIASSVHDYEEGSLTFNKDFTKKYRLDVDPFLQQVYGEFILNYLLNKMKANLKQHFQGPILYEFQYCRKEKEKICFSRRTTWIIICRIQLGIKIVGHKPSEPYLMYLSPKDNGVAPQTLDTRVVSSQDVQETYFGLHLDHDEHHILTRSINDIHNFKYTRVLEDLFTVTNTTEYRLRYSEKQIEEFDEKILDFELHSLVQELTNYLKTPDKPLNLFHVIIKDLVFDVSDIQTNKQRDCHPQQWRVATFRDDFFISDDKHIKTIRHLLLNKVLNETIRYKLSNKRRQRLISLFLSEPSASTLTPLLEAYIVGYKDNTLKFLVKRPIADVERLRQMNIQKSTIEQAMLSVRAAAMQYLRSLKLKVSVYFGNIDFLIFGDLEVIEITIQILLNDIVELCEQSEPSKVIDIHDDTFLTMKGLDKYMYFCLGNLLIYDEETKMLKFSQQYTPKQENAKRLFNELSKRIDNLHEYRLDNRSGKFLKLRLGSSHSAREFLSRLVICAGQGNHYELEGISLTSDKTNL